MNRAFLIIFIPATVVLVALVAIGWGVPVAISGGIALLGLGGFLWVRRRRVARRSSALPEDRVA